MSRAECWAGVATATTLTDIPGASAVSLAASASQEAGQKKIETGKKKPQNY